jgi:hypothetical protein
MKQSAVEKVANELRAEKAVIDGLLDEFKDRPDTFKEAVEAKSGMLSVFIARLSSNGSEPAAPKPTRTRRGRKAAGADL